MNKYIIYTIAGIMAVGVITAGIVLAVKKSEHRPGGTESDTRTTIDSSAAGKKIPFSQFIKKSGSYQCTVNQNLDNYHMTATGTTYLDNGKIRGDFNATYGTMEISGHTIIRDGYAYTWTSMMNTGWKSPLIESNGDTQSNVTISGNTYRFNANQIGDYDCQPWIPNASLFVLPTGITFQEVK